MTVPRLCHWTTLIPVLWAGAMAVGIIAVALHSVAPSDPGTPAVRWPERASVPLSSSGPTLVMIAHPKCPCTESSLQELSAILRTATTPVLSYALFFSPDGEDESWHRTSNWRKAQEIPGLIVRRDSEGREARRFGATTSGHVLLYSSSGDLLFSGGITPRRGHSGWNAGRQAVLSLLDSGVSPVASTPVFGCSVQVGRS